MCKKSKFCIFCINLNILVLNSKITNGEVLNDSMMHKMELGRFGQKIKILLIWQQIAYFKHIFCIFCILRMNSHILIWNTEISNREVFGDSVILKTELGRFLPWPLSPWDVSSLGHFFSGPFSLWAKISLGHFGYFPSE